MAEYYKDTKKYEKYYELQYPFDDSRPRMPLHDRAAQFAPFAALSGHEEAIEETARLTEEKILLDETAIQAINEKLHELSQRLGEKPTVSITYFKPDKQKNGGAYLTDIGTVKKIDEIEKVVIMDSGMKIPMEHIVSI